MTCNTHANKSYPINKREPLNQQKVNAKWSMFKATLVNNSMRHIVHSQRNDNVMNIYSKNNVQNDVPETKCDCFISKKKCFANLA